MLSYLFDILLPIASLSILSFIVLHDTANIIAKNIEETTFDDDETNNKNDGCKSEIQELKNIITAQNKFILELNENICCNRKCLKNIKKIIEEQTDLLSSLIDKLSYENYNEEETSDSYITID